MGAFVVTRRKYSISVPTVFIPSLPTAGEPMTTEDLLGYLSKLDVSYEAGQWRIGVKPINSFQVPIAMYLPTFAPLAIPQIVTQLKDKLVIQEYKPGGFLMGHYVFTKEPITVWI